MPEENHSVDEQIIPAKTKYSKIRQYNPKKPIKWGFKNIVRAGSSGFMYDFYIYPGKNSCIDLPVDAKGLQKCAQAVAKVCLTLQRNAKKNQGILSCGTIRANRLHGCVLEPTKEMKKSGRGSLDYKSHLQSGTVVVKWLDNEAVHLASNFAGVEPVERWCNVAKFAGMDSVERWCNVAKEK
jgi:hypothetical protein